MLQGELQRLSLPFHPPHFLFRFPVSDLQPPGVEEFCTYIQIVHIAGSALVSQASGDT